MLLSTPIFASADFILSISFSAITESLYSEMQPDFLSIILEKCPNLQTLECVGCSFMSDNAFFYFPIGFSQGAGQVNKLKMKKHINLRSLNVKDVDLSYSSCLNDTVLSTIPKLCSNLNSLKIAGTNISEKGFASVGRNLSSLQILDCSYCLGITDFGFSTLFNVETHEKGTLHIASSSNDPPPFRYQCSLDTLILKDCLNLSDVSLRTIASSPRSAFLRVLDISGCSKNGMKPESLDVLARNLGTYLEELRLSHTIIDSFVGMTIGAVLPSYEQLEGKVTVQPHVALSVFCNFVALHKLTLSDVNEKTDGSFVWSLASRRMEKLRIITIIRNTYSKDFIITNMYADVPANKHLIDAEFSELFRRNFGPKCVVNILIEE
ncbi:hypothetical protein HK096_011307 [Nowakowskiella sp. JEL0078]|nr:hypothetical protein HK096_011307 [Nowakowskiella sp. JEL0078]